MIRQKLIKKITSLLTLAVGGTVSFSAICMYQGNENFYRNLLMPSIHTIMDPERAHYIALQAAKMGLIPESRFKENGLLESTVWGLKFKNPIGIAAGFDKDGEAVSGLFKTGIGFLEIGSVTPEPQDGNPRPRLFGLEEDEAIINRCGFNSKGHKYVRMKLELFDKGKGIIGVNLGKNKTSESAENDYVQGIKEFHKIADYFVINVSSPNTPGLRSLQSSKNLELILDKVIEANNSNPMTSINLQDKGGKPPILVKIAPDLSYEEKKDIAKVISRKGKEVDGLIVSNTTITRPENLKSSQKNEIGGLSGKPLFMLSLETIHDMYQLTKGKIPIIGVGGVSSGHDAYEKIKAGASLIQLYSALIYSGPPLINKIKSELQELLLADGYTNISQAVGAVHKK